MAERGHELAVIYARFSTKNQDPRSIEDQFRRCEEYATDEGFRVVARYNERGRAF